MNKKQFFLYVNLGVCNSKNTITYIHSSLQQVQKIRQLLKKGKFEDIDVGSVEEFQGQERLIIIVSTVRCNPEYLSLDFKHNLGFLRNPKVNTRFLKSSEGVVTISCFILCFIGFLNFACFSIYYFYWNFIIMS